MFNLKKAIPLKRALSKFVRAGNLSSTMMGRTGHLDTSSMRPEPVQLRETHDFGSNPGNLRMLSYRPPSAAPNCGLLVVLHGCHQTAAGFDHGAGWSALAERDGFALLFPEQQRANNPNGCFNWFVSGDTQRDRGEALSIRQMIEKIADEQAIDRDRVFITGLSAGGAMTSVMLACYPEVFAGGAIVAGLPYGAATSVREAFESMSQPLVRAAHAWGDLVRGASGYKGPWPRVSIWHGNADTIVIPSNARELLKQWTDVHGLPLTPSAETVVDGVTRQIWTSPAGDELIESYAIPGMAHGVPLALGDADNQGGAAGPFFLNVGISSSYHIAKFFGLTTGSRERAPRTANARQWSAGANPAPADKPSGVLVGEILDKETETASTGSERATLRPLDVGAVITKALTAAGLMKGR